MADHGDDDVYNLSRLRWLDSKIGVDGEATWPRSRFANISMAADKGGGFVLGLNNKDVTIGTDGLPSMVTVRTDKERQGKTLSRSLDLLASPVRLDVLDAVGKPVVFAVTAAATITNRTSAAVSWTAKLSGGGVDVSLTGKLEMDSYLTFEALLSATTATIAVSDVQLIVAANGSVARRM